MWDCEGSCGSNPGTPDEHYCFEVTIPADTDCDWILAFGTLTAPSLPCTCGGDRGSGQYRMEVKMWGNCDPDPDCNDLESDCTLIDTWCDILDNTDCDEEPPFGTGKCCCPE